MSSPFLYCPLCAEGLQPFSDGERLRSRCPNCGWIYYRNPTVGVAVVLLESGRLLLGERRDGGWCIPCGHVEWDESIEKAAVREFAEETGLQVELEEFSRFTLIFTTLMTIRLESGIVAAGWEEN